MAWAEPADGPTPIDPEKLPTRARKDVRKYLLEGEEPVIATRRHWAVLIGPTVRFLPVVLAGGWLLLLDPDNRVTSTLGMLVTLGALVVFALRVGEWWMRHFIVSKRRVLLTSGVIVRTVTLLPLRRITDLTWKETFFGQLLGYGTFRFESAGQQQALSETTFLPNAGVLYQTVSAQLFPRDAVSPDTEGDGTGEAEADGSRAVVTAQRRDTEPIPPLPPQQP